MEKRQTTSSIKRQPDGSLRASSTAAASPYEEILDAMPVPALLLTPAGIIGAANRAFIERLHTTADAVLGEPLLAWISRAGERGAFGRAFLGLRSRPAGHAFTVALTLQPAAPGASIACQVRACTLASGDILVTCELDSGAERSPETEMGRAITRSLEALDQGMLVLDAQGRIVHANRAARDLLGDRIVGRSLLESVDPGEVEHLGRALTLAASGNWHGEVELRGADGEAVPIELSLAASRGAGAPTVALLRDLHEQRQREFEERLVAQLDRHLLASPRPRESVPAACRALLEGLRLERAQLIVQIAGRWERWDIDRRRELTQREIDAPPLHWRSGAQVHPVDPTDPESRALFGDLSLTHPAVRVLLTAPTGVVGYLLLVNGRPHPFDRRIRSLLALLGPQLALGLASGLLVAETEALAGYQALLLDQTTVLLNSLDADGRVVTWNRASEQLLGITAADAAGRRFGVEVAVASDPARWHDLWAALCSDGMIVNEIAIRTAGGVEIPLHLEARLLRDSSGVLGAVLVGLDLRRRRALEDQVLRSQKLAAVGLLAAGIAHEINNPLSGVVGYSRLLLERPLDPWIRDRIIKIADSGERCRKIVEGVLLFSRQQEPGQRRRLDLSGLIDRVVGIGEYQWRMHNVQVLRSYPEQPVEVYADADQLEQVLLNLLANAVDAMPRGGAVTVDLSRRGDGWASLAVRDEGHGIPAEIQPRIFDPFFSTKEIGKGTGLGLAISYGIIKDHGGEILLRSAPGAGSTFTVLLPPDELTPPAPTSSAPTSPSDP
jgi:PAS domain S-box-containing protein